MELINHMPDGLRKWRTELPNIIDDSDLDPYEFRLLVHYYRVAANNVNGCFESAQTTAKKCHMSAGKVSEVRQQLAEKGWIKIKRSGDIGTEMLTISIIDKWQENMENFGGGTPSPHEAPPSPHEAKKEHIKKEQYITSVYNEILQVWAELFPDKPQPRKNNQTLLRKLNTRMKDSFFRENWEAALVRASKSSWLLGEPFFTVSWFLKNDDNWEKCFNGNYDNNGKDKNVPQVRSDTKLSKSETWDAILSQIKQHASNRANKPEFEDSLKKLGLLGLWGKLHVTWYDLCNMTDSQVNELKFRLYEVMK